MLECNVSKPNRQATWFKSGEKIVPSEQLSLTCDGQLHKMIIDGVTTHDSSQYSVLIDGLSSACNVTVHGVYMCATFV